MRFTQPLEFCIPSHGPGMTNPVYTETKPELEVRRGEVTVIEWHMEGIQYGSCNCDHACPCQFEGLPNHGHCQGFDVIRVEKGSFDGVD